MWRMRRIDAARKREKEKDKKPPFLQLAEMWRELLQVTAVNAAYQTPL